MDTISQSGPQTTQEATAICTGTCRADSEPRPVELVLAGSGAACLAHIGVLRALSELGVKPELFTGSSQGALVAALAANGYDWRAIAELFHNKRLPVFRREDWLGSRAGCERMFCPVKDLLPPARKLVSELKLKLRENLRVLAYDLATRRTVVPAGTLAETLAAAVAVPGITRPVRLAGAVLVDCALAESNSKTVACRQTRRVVSRVHAGAKTGEGALLLVDGWLQQRKKLLHLAAPATACGEQDVLVETAVQLAGLCGCQPSEAALDSVIDAGYRCALEALRS